MGQSSGLTTGGSWQRAFKAALHAMREEAAATWERRRNLAIGRGPRCPRQGATLPDRPAGDWRLNGGRQKYGWGIRPVDAL